MSLRSDPIRAVARSCRNSYGNSFTFHSFPVTHVKRSVFGDEIWTYQHRQQHQRRTFTTSASTPTPSLAYHHTTLGDSLNRRPVLFLHCLLGDRHQFRQLQHALHAQLASQYLGIDAYYLDARNHGDSFHSLSHTYQDLVEDVLQFIQQHGLNTPANRPVIIAHSMGARTACVLALQHPQTIAGIVSLDASPVTYKHSHSHLFEAMHCLSLPSISDKLDPLASEKKMIRNEETFASIVPNWKNVCNSELTKWVHSSVDRAFILHNLRLRENLRNQPHFENLLANDKSPNHSITSRLLGWAANIPTLAKNEHEIHNWPLERSQLTYREPSLFIGGLQSTRLTEPHNLSELRRFFPAHELCMFPGGHFVHTAESKNVAIHIIDWMKKHSII